MSRGSVYIEQAEKDAEALYQAGEGRLGTTDSVFIDIFSRSSAEHLQAVSTIYQRSHKKHTLEQAVKSETSGDYQKALLALCTPRAVHVAQRIHDAVKGLGNKKILIGSHIIRN